MFFGTADDLLKDTEQYQKLSEGAASSEVTTSL
jgi:hypothetical protein